MASNTNCEMHTIILIVVIALIMAYTSELFIMFPVLKNLFADPITFIALIILVILVLLIDIPCGILLAFLILYLAVWLKNYNKNVINRFADITLASQLATQNNSMSVGASRLAANPPAYSESELFYDNKVAPNGNIPPFQPIDNASIATDTVKVNLSPAANQAAQRDHITQSGQPDRAGFDITGCRFDYKNSPQNLTKYGPPLSACGAYNSSQISKCGTLFYPLNA
jgi:hypothetical protein